MKAELNERNEVVVTMSRGDAQRVANAAWRNRSTDLLKVESCFEFAQNISELGIEFIFTK